MFKLRHLILSLVASAGILIVFSTSAHAATIDVAAGTDAIDDNSVCQLSEAIDNINDAAQTHDDCVETGAYGTDDTINLPVGTITLTADLQPITESITITGQGMGASVIDGDGQWEVIKGGNGSNESLILHGFTIQNYFTSAVAVNGEATTSIAIEELEVDGSGVTQTVANSHGILILNKQPSELLSVVIENVYVHDIAATAIGGGGLFGIMIANSDAVDLLTDITVHSVAISNLTNTGQVTGLTLGAGYFGDASGSMEADVSNITKEDVSSSSNASVGLSVGSVVGGGGALQSTIESAVNNVSIHDIHGTDTGLGFGAASIALTTTAIPAGSLSTANIAASNLLISDIDAGCVVLAMDDLFGGGAGTSTPSLTSQGGNLTDDTTCNSYFTEPTDQNNVTNLASTLGTLGDYGGYVPTIPLLEGSPAIDAGVTVAGLTSDARGVSRPLGLAYDSGAYESPYTQSTDTETASLAETGRDVYAPILFIALLLGCSLLLFRKHRTV